jgi:hypothetical protein
MPTILKIKRTIENDIWKINFSLDLTSLSEYDKDLMRKFGEPKFNIGGAYLLGTPNEYSLPDKYIKVRSDLPYVQEFDSKSPAFSENTEAKAVAFQTVFVNLYESAFMDLRSMTDTFTGEYLVNF